MVFNLQKVIPIVLITWSAYISSTPVIPPRPTTPVSHHLGGPSHSPQLTPANIPTHPINIPLPQIHIPQLPIPQLNLGPFSLAAGPTLGLDIDQNGLNVNVGAGAGAGVAGNNVGASAGISLGSSGISVGADAGALAGSQLVGAGAQAGLTNVNSQTLLASAGAETQIGSATHPIISGVGAQTVLPSNGVQHIPTSIHLQQGAPGGQLGYTVSQAANPLQLSLSAPPVFVNLGGHPYLALSFTNGQILLAPPQLSLNPQPLRIQAKSSKNSDKSVSNTDKHYLFSHKKSSKVLKI